MRTVFLDKENATKQSDNSYKFTIDRPNDVPIQSVEVQSAVATFAPQVSESADPSQIANLNPNLWLNMKNTAKMTPSPNEGDFVTSITGSGNAGMTLIGSSSTAIRYRKVRQAYGLKSEASWHAMSDT